MVERAGFASAQCQHKTVSSGALALSSYVLRASTCHLFAGRSTRAAPHTRRAHVCPQQDGLYMLPYCQQFCNIFPASSPSVWQKAWTAWRPLSPASLARIRRWLQTACRTPRPLSTPLLYVTRTHPPTPHSATRTWWTPRSVSLLDTHPCTRRHPPHVLAKAAGCLGAPDGFAVIVLERMLVVHVVLRTCWRSPLYLLEKRPCTYWRSPLVPTGEAPCTYWRKNMV
jgi:hypothetical protein